jgi:hypothetical protein
MKAEINSSNASSMGNERFKADVRCFGGLLLVLGAMATINPLANVAAGITPGMLPTEGIPLWSLIGGVSVVIMGTLAMLVGYLALVHEYGNRILTASLIAVTQLAWIPFITDLTATGKGAGSNPVGNPFIPGAYNPSASDVKLVGAMGVLAIICYGFGFLGSLGFMEFTLLAYQSGKPGDRSGLYYRGRMNLYMFLLALAGLTQLIVGSLALSLAGSGPLDSDPIAVAVYVVHFPEIAIFVGLVQIIMGAWGMARRFGLLVGGANDHSYQISLGVTWLFVLSMMTMTQVSYGPGDANAGAAPTIATLTFGLHLMAAILDFKARTTPDEIPDDYYGMDVPALQDVETERQEGV